MPEPRVAIVGGGIGGLTLACCLRQRGIAFEGVEIAPAFAPVGAGIALGSNAMAVLRALGLGEALEARGARIRVGRISDERGRVLTESDMDALGRRFGSMLAIHRADLHAVLAQAAGDDVRLATGVRALRDEGGAVEVDWSDGRSGRFDVVIGADGIASTVRETAVAERERRYSGYRCWRLCVELATDGWPGGDEMWGRGLRFGIVPIGRGRVYCFAVENAPRGTADPPAGRADRLRSRFASFGGHAPAVLARVRDEDVHFDDIDELAEGPWVAGRVALLGDAAHALTPNMGQGAAMAIEDAWVLAGELASRGAGPEALRAYEARRRPRVAAVQRRSRRLGRVAQLRARPLCAARDWLTRLTPAGAAQRALAAFLEDAPVPIAGRPEGG